MRSALCGSAGAISSTRWIAWPAAGTGCRSSDRAVASLDGVTVAGFHLFADLDDEGTIVVYAIDICPDRVGTSGAGRGLPRCLQDLRRSVPSRPWSALRWGRIRRHAMDARTENPQLSGTERHALDIPK